MADLDSAPTAPVATEEAPGTPAAEPLPVTPATPRDAYVVDDAGVVSTAPAEETYQLFAAGYKPANPDQIQLYQAQKQLEAKNAGVGNAVLAFATKASETMLPGANALAAKYGGGLSPEDTKELWEQRPGPAMAGTAAGVALPMLATMGAGAAPSAAGTIGKAASFTLPAMASKAGMAVEQLAARGLGVGMGAKIAGMVARGASEGAIYAAANMVSESTLGDPRLSGEFVLAHPDQAGAYALERLLEGAAVGGVAGGALQLSSVAAKAAKNALASKIAPKGILEVVEEFAGERALKAAGATQKDIKLLTAQKGRDRLLELGREMHAEGLFGKYGLASADDILSNAEDLRHVAGAQIGKLLKKADAVLPNVPGPDINAIVDRVKQSVVDPLAQNPFNAGVASKVDDVFEAYRSKFSQKPLTFSDLHEMRQEVSKQVYGLKSQFDPASNALRDALHDTRSLLSRELEDSLGRAGVADDIWKAANRRYEVATTAEKLANHGVERSHGNNMMSLTEWMGTLAGMLHGGPISGAGMYAATAASRRYGSGVMTWAAEKVAETLEAHVQTVSQVSQLGQWSANTLAAAAPAILSGGERKVVDIIVPMLATREERQESFRGKANQIRQFQDMNVAQERVAALSREWESSIPKTAQSAQMVASRAMGFLASKLPPAPVDSVMDRAAGVVPVYSDNTISTFNRYFEAVKDPYSILESAKAGALTKEEVEAVSTVYPQLFSKIQGQLVEDIAAAKGHIDFRQRGSVELLLGMPLSSMRSVADLQAIYAPEPQKKPAAPKGKPQALKIANRTSLDTHDDKEKKG